MKYPIVQQVELADGRVVSISRNGHHQYRIKTDTDKDYGPLMPSVTTTTGHLSGDTFGIGMNWALKVARENGGDINAPKVSSRKAIDEGERLHEAIRKYISSGSVDEENPMFVAWLNEVGYDREWVATEQHLAHPVLCYGGTVDALSREKDGSIAIWDWKTKEQASYEKYGADLKHKVQVAAYAHALQALNARYVPIKGYITYIMRDGHNAVDTVEVDLDKYFKLYTASLNMYNLVKEIK